MYVLELGGEDDAFAAAEAAVAARDVAVIAPGVALARGLDADRFRSLAFGRRAGELLARCEATSEAAGAAVRSATVDRDGPVAVRARDVRGTADVDTQAIERVVGSVLVDRGFTVDLETPDHVLLVLCAGDECVLAWQLVESERGYGDRLPTDRPFFQPGSMDPLLARSVVNLARVEPGDVVLDPMCGTGGLLIEAGLVGGRPVGFDAQRKMTAGTRENLGKYLDGRWDVGMADATRLPLADGAADAIVLDAPYGRQSKIATHGLGDLVAGALAEARRVAPRGVLVADRSWHVAAESAGWSVERVFQRRVHRSLDRYVHVLS
ncbi:methyltransferase domain-containing protein [Halanaeroarchaeum sulfurireducens]|uniref:tRNA (guanine(10)-N(2))-dimethyltransferase n=1 Tax=Halanaeroarchaeum sulfurireducens TaxID=1604004 RepID=A0A0F7PG13_9EURY|nr:methyltransferase domain-containing protein [Halanaeroarchaeum sulfurireducens]AKH98514.1 RNA methylase [Halanaeroarchaeum sulfurireducens]